MAAIEVSQLNPLNSIVRRRVVGSPGELIVADVGTGADTERGFGSLVKTRYAVSEAGLELDVQAKTGGHHLCISAHNLVRDLCVFPEMIQPNGTTDRQLIALLPGESTQIHLRGLKGVEPRQLRSPSDTAVC